MRLSGKVSRRLLLLVLAALYFFPSAVRAGKIAALPEADEGMRLLYDGDADAAIERFRIVQQKLPAHPLGYLLEVDALWWKVYCSACERKWNMVDAWKRSRLPSDDAYLSLANRAIALASAALKKQETAEMHFHAGMGLALKARLHGLRDERRATARAGVAAREHFLRVLALDPGFTDAYTGLGLYNYYVDTLSTFARVLRFFMGIPGGSKQEGMRQLEMAIAGGGMTAVEARFYLAKALRNYEQKYAEAIELMLPLVERHPRNAVFRLLLGDMYAKLARNEQATAEFRAAMEIPNPDAACRARIQKVARESLDALAPTKRAE